MLLRIRTVSLAILIMWLLAILRRLRGVVVVALLVLLWGLAVGGIPTVVIVAAHVCSRKALEHTMKEDETGCRNKVGKGS